MMEFYTTQKNDKFRNYILMNLKTNVYRNQLFGLIFKDFRI